MSLKLNTLRKTKRWKELKNSDLNAFSVEDEGSEDDDTEDEEEDKEGEFMG